MARGRMISKSLSTSQRYAALEQHAGKLAEFCQALYPLLVAHADDHGRQAGDEFTIKHLVHPTSRRSLEDFSVALRALHDSHLIIWYQVNGCKYLEIDHFDDHQVGLHKRRESKIPIAGVAPPKVPGTSGESPVIPGTSGEFPLKGTELKRTEQNRREEDLVSADADAAHDYMAFVTAYPAGRRVGGKIARAAFSQATRGHPERLAVMLAALEQHKRSEQWQMAKMIPLMTTWLTQERWVQVLPEPSAMGTSAKTAGNLSALERFANRKTV